jgi:integrase
VGGKWETVSPYLLANSGGKETNIKGAGARRDAIKSEVANGVSNSVLNWLQPDQIGRLRRKLTLAALNPVDGCPQTWEAARDAWLRSYETGESIRVEGKINATPRSPEQRQKYIKQLLAYVSREKIDLVGVDITRVFIDSFATLRGKKKPKTIKVQCGYLVLFAGFLARKKLCSKPDREEIQASLPPQEPAVVEVPDWRQDLEVMRKLREHRHSPGRWSAWALFLAVRGLGCRPDEALHLSWDNGRLRTRRRRVHGLQGGPPSD